MALFNSTSMVPQIFHYNLVHPVTCEQNPTIRENVSSRKSGPNVKTKAMEQVGTGLRNKTQFILYVTMPEKIFNTGAPSIYTEHKCEDVTFEKNRT